MKRILIIFLMLFELSGTLLFADDLAKNEYMTLDLDWESAFFLTPQAIYEIRHYNETYQKLDRRDFKLSENGWFYYKSNFYIPGQNPELSSVMIDRKNQPRYSSYDFYNFWFNAKYTASSVLKEKSKDEIRTYQAGYLGTFAYTSDKPYESLSWNFDHYPWAEGENGYGIGTSIKMSTEQPFKMVIILNGYVDPMNPDLYRNNSRVKLFSVHDLDNDDDYYFEMADCVCFQFFYLNKQTKNIELTIKEVYEGDTWDNTCITAIIPEKNNSTIRFDKYQKYSPYSSKNDIIETLKIYTSKYNLYKYENEPYK